ncbi:Asp23/Gls24 family envelope stress response protein [Modestobacter italicus]|nr:Asp23/Gls24 family envelope stress response protein [Modestobacter marinus]
MTDHDDRHGDRLPCGVRADDLLQQVIDGTPPRDPVHQASCPHCRATLTHLSELWAPVLDLAHEDVRAPAGLLQAVMSEIRELARSGWSAVLRDDAGQTRIAARVVGAVARLAAESVPHVTLALGGGRVATGSGEESDPAAVAGSEDATDVGLAGDRVVIDVQIAVDLGVSIPRVAQQVRDRIADHLRVHTGLRTTEVNVTVVDVRS